MATQVPIAVLSHEELTGIVEKWEGTSSDLQSLERYLLDWQRTLHFQKVSATQQHWRDLAAAVLVAGTNGVKGALRLPLTAIYRRLLVSCTDQQSTLQASLTYLIARFLSIPGPRLELPQRSEGGIARGLQSWCRADTLVHPEEHALVACLCVLGGVQFQDKELIRVAEAAAQWLSQMTSYHADFLPPLFVQAVQWKPARLRRYGAYLFHALHQMTGADDHAHLATVWRARASVGDEMHDALDVCLSQACSVLSEVDMNACRSQGGVFEDSGSCLLSARAEDAECWLTLHGCGTGLGCARWGDLALLSYGPSLGVLGDLDSFGIGANRFYSGRVKCCETMAAHPCLGQEGRVAVGRLRADGRDYQSAPLWLDVQQVWNGQRLDVHVDVIQDPLSELQAFFCFFVHAQSVHLSESAQSVQSGSMNHWCGSVQSMDCWQGESVVQLSSGFTDGQLHVIPLAGSEFWGTDFLIAYSLPSVSARFHWSMQWAKQV